MDLHRAPNDTALLAAAARLVVHEGLEYADAKRRALKLLGLSARSAWPDNASLDRAVREHIAVFCPDTQAAELHALRTLALTWMERLANFRPHLCGAVWHGTATRHSDIHLQLFCDDPKATEWTLLDQRIPYYAGSAKGWRGHTVPALTLRLHGDAQIVRQPAVSPHRQAPGHLELARSPRETDDACHRSGDAQTPENAAVAPRSPENPWLLMHLLLHDRDELRGALKPDSQGRSPRGDASALRKLLLTP